MIRTVRKKRLGIFILGGILTFILLGIFLQSKKQEQKPSSPKEKFTEEETQAIIESAALEEEYPYDMVDTANDAPEKPEIELSAWIAYWDFNKSIEVYKQNSNSIASLSPTWYFVQSDGSLGLKNTARNSQLTNLRDQYDLKIIPSISNSNADEFSAILNDPNLLNNHIQAIAGEVEQYGYDGIDIDYENLKRTDKDQFSAFIRQLAEELHKNDRILTIAILWKNDLNGLIDVFSESRAAQDWEEIGKHVDEFRIMAYDYTHSYNSQGPIAPQDWIRSILEYAIKNVDRDKIVLGLPLYAYEWIGESSSAKALVWDDVNYRILNFESQIIKNELHPEHFEKQLIYKDGDTEKIVWYQDSKVTQKRIELAQTFGINKFVFWRMGGEDPDTYTTNSNL